MTEVLLFVLGTAFGIALGTMFGVAIAKSRSWQDVVEGIVGQMNAVKVGQHCSFTCTFSRGHFSDDDGDCENPCPDDPRFSAYHNN